MSTPPNILLIMADEHAAQFTGNYGCSEIDTPNLDRLAEQGVAFDNAYCNTPLCAPSRKSMLCGRLACNCEAYDNTTFFDARLPTIAHVLGAAGYETILNGKMHFVGPDLMHGFERRDFADKPDPWKQKLSNPVRGAVDWRREPQKTFPLREKFETCGPRKPDKKEADAGICRETVRFLTEECEDRERPFFYVSSMHRPHYAFTPSQEKLEKYLGKVSPPNVPEGHLAALHPVNQALRRHYDVIDLPEELTLRARAAYFALIDEMDERVGLILAALEQSGRAQDTIVLFTADHGDMAGEHGMWFKCVLYDQSSRVPFIVRWPGVVQPGTRKKEVISLVDLMPTLAEMAGAPCDCVMDGQSFVPLLRGSATDWKNSAICEFYGEGLNHPVRMLRWGKYKLNWLVGYEPELFDMEADPGEFENLAARPEHKETLERLKQKLFEGWDPAETEARVRRNQQDRLLIGAARRALNQRNLTYRINGDPLPLHQ